jgi:hypothetical protein
VAQATVIQMVQNVFSRIPNPKTAKKPAMLKSESNLAVASTIGIQETRDFPEPSYDREFKDAFKVFRTLCVLSVKAIPTPDGYSKSNLELSI